MALRRTDTESLSPSTAKPRTVHTGTALGILSLAAFMASLDLFIVNVAFTRISAAFDHAPLSQVSWVLNAYAIIFAALLVPLGRLVDRHDRKAGFLTGVAVFTGASLGCAVSASLWMLIAFRLLQAAGAAMLTPASLGLLLSVFPPERRAGAVRTWASTGALAAAVGPVVGGLLTTASWRWVFLVNLPVGALLIALAARVLPASHDERGERVPDVVGTVLLTAGIGLVALGLVQANAWSVPRSTLVLAAGVLACGAFWLRSLRHENPLVEPALMRVRSFAWANLTALVFSIAFAANLLAAILWMQQVWHYSALRTGLGLVPGPLVVPFATAVGGRLAKRVPPSRLAAIGCVILAASVLSQGLLLDRTPDYATELLPGWFIGGIGVGLALPFMLGLATATLPPPRFATGSAIVNMSRQVGAVLGVSLFVALIGVPTTYSDTHTAFMKVWYAIVLCMGVSAVTALGMAPPRSVPAEQPAAPARAE
ncbi:DHA2 family efflux MFS transporter permease subunit [Streptomyces rishiriensis]|uniref:DHA2 family efflux MFS transporter permease subunit n=1 Tax=Streptomyces rishiriensis TaxID=68264 RepID=UPI0037B87756